MSLVCLFSLYLFFSSRRRHTRCALVTGVQTCALPIYALDRVDALGVGALHLVRLQDLPELADQRVGALAVFELVGDQFLLRGVLQVLDQPDEQVGGIVERLAVLRADEDRGQRVAFDRDQFGKLAGIERAGDREIGRATWRERGGQAG